MPDNKTNYLENALLNHVLRGNVGGTAFPQPAAIFMALYTVLPTETGGGTEVAGNGYARQQITFTVPSGGQVSNNSLILYPNSTAAWGLVVGFGLLDSLSGGNLLYYGPFSSAVNIDAANRRVEIEAGSVIVQEL
jgi:hypothetical protein